VTCAYFNGIALSRVACDERTHHADQASLGARVMFSITAERDGYGWGRDVFSGGIFVGGQFPSFCHPDGLMASTAPTSSKKTLANILFPCYG
jgi:hypothetical protein